MFLFDTWPTTYKPNVLASIYVEQSFMFNVICNVYNSNNNNNNYYYNNNNPSVPL